MNAMMDHLQTSLRALAIFVLACLITLVSKNTFAVESESRLPAEQEITAEDQAMNAADMQITRKIRQQIVKNDQLSLTARNVKIISRDGRVTIKGPVASDREKTVIGEVASNVVGVGNVLNDTVVMK